MELIPTNIYSVERGASKLALGVLSQVKRDILIIQKKLQG